MGRFSAPSPRAVARWLLTAALLVAACASTPPETYYRDTSALGITRQQRLHVGQVTCADLHEIVKLGDPVGEGLDTAYVDLRNTGAGQTAAVQVIGASVDHLCPRYTDDFETWAWQGKNGLHDFLDVSCLASSPTPTHPGCPVQYVD